jgi:hypothetical protein
MADRLGNRQRRRSDDARAGNSLRRRLPMASANSALILFPARSRSVTADSRPFGRRQIDTAQPGGRFLDPLHRLYPAQREGVNGLAPIRTRRFDGVPGQQPVRSSRYPHQYRPWARSISAARQIGLVACRPALEKVGLGRASASGCRPRCRAANAARGAGPRLCQAPAGCCLLDEPFDGLGPGLAADMLDLMLEIRAEVGATVLMVTHDPDEASAAADQILFVAGRAHRADAPAAGFFDRARLARS